MTKIGNIYKIIHTQSNIVYVGSTFNEIRTRFSQHKSSYSKWLNGKHSDISIYPYFKEFGIEQFKMILIKSYEVSDRAQLQAYEQLWINWLKPINKNGLFRIKKLYREVISEYNEQYYESNKETLSDRKKQIIKCECGMNYTRRHKARHQK
jgi:uncharacterized UPF0160 family protein